MKETITKLQPALQALHILSAKSLPKVLVICPPSALTETLKTIDLTERQMKKKMFIAP